MLIIVIFIISHKPFQILVGMNVTALLLSGHLAWHSEGLLCAVFPVVGLRLGAGVLISVLHLAQHLE